jgi:hypothetical protein
MLNVTNRGDQPDGLIPSSILMSLGDGRHEIMIVLHSFVLVLLVLIFWTNRNCQVTNHNFGLVVKEVVMMLRDYSSWA